MQEALRAVHKGASMTHRRDALSSQEGRRGGHDHQLMCSIQTGLDYSNINHSTVTFSEKNDTIATFLSVINQSYA